MGIGKPYKKGNLKIVDVKTPDGYFVRHFYVSPNVKIGDKVTAGRTMLGQAQHVAKGKKGMTNHVHVEIREPLMPIYEKNGLRKFKDIKPKLLK